MICVIDDGARTCVRADLTAGSIYEDDLEEEVDAEYDGVAATVAARRSRSR